MQKDEAYRNLSDLIFKGFLTAELDIDGKLFIFKTISEREFDLIKMYSGKPTRSDYYARFNNYFLIFSVFMMDGRNILFNRDNNISILYDFFLSLPNVLTTQILKNINEMRKESYEVIKYLEGFCYTNQSRNAWKTLNGLSPVSVDITGIPGTEQMGLNIHQESWTLINRSLDAEDDYNQQFSMASMVASASNPKGARQIRNSFESSQLNVEDRRKKMARDGYIGAKRSWSAEGWAAPVDTAEELVAELDRQIHGIKDKHDKILDQYYKNLRDEAERKTKEAEERIRKAREGSDGVFIDGSQRAASPEEVNGLMFTKSTTTMVAAEEAEKPGDRDKFYSKVGSRVLTNKG